MSPPTPEPLCEPVLVSAGIPHGFGQRSSQVPDSTVFVDQVHGTGVFELTDPEVSGATEADAIVSAIPGTTVGIVTADCVPILAASADGSAVAAIHAGWRGLAAGVIESGLAALRASSGRTELVCAVGPAARGCCYEVDEPVREGLSSRYRPLLEEVLRPSDPLHFQLDLPLLATRILESAGVETSRIGVTQRVCTICDPERFESYRRDGAFAGRLRHFITRSMTIPRQG